MKTAVIIGGSSGIGLSIASVLDDYDKIMILDIKEPHIDLGERYEYKHFDLCSDDYSMLSAYSGVSALFITAGVGSLKLFAHTSQTEIEKTFGINTIGPIKVLQQFYNRLLSKSEDFFCAVMVSIAGWVNSPFFSIYSASKGAMHLFIEAVNVELEKSGAINRILEVSPGKINGTSFYGGVTDINGLRGLSERIVISTKKKEQLLIPDIDVYGPVIMRYNADHHSFGLESFDFKIKSGRVKQ